MQKRIGCVIKSFFTIVAFFVNTKFLEIDRIMLLFLFVVLYKMYYRFKGNNNLVNIFSLFISIVMMLGKSFDINNSTDLITNNVVISIVSFLGYYFFYKTIISIIINKYISYKDEFSNKHIFLFSWFSSKNDFRDCNCTPNCPTK